MDTFSKNLRKMRKKLGLTQEGLARVLNTTKTTIFRYEKHGASPSLSVLQNIHQKLNVDLNWLLNDTGDPDHMFLERKELVEKSGINDAFPDIPPDKEVIELVKCLEVPIMRYSLIVKYLEYRKLYEAHIEEYYNREKGKDTGKN